MSEIARAGDAASDGGDLFVRTAFVVPRTEAEGPGVRYALWVQGCTIGCPGCCNPEFLPAEGGSLRSVLALAREAEREPVEGVSLLGGEPFQQPEPLALFAQLARAAGLSVMVFTGYTLDELEARAANEPAVRALLDATDLLVDGRFEAGQRTETRRWVGSENQRMHFLSDRYAPTDPRFSEPNTLEIRLRNGVIELNGFPVKGAATRLIAPGALSRVPKQRPRE